MDNELEVIRDEMEQTRANLAEKLGALENQVRETVSSTTEAVSSTVDGVKNVVSTVSETVETVTETFNVSKQVEQNPWLAMGAAVATGFVIAQVIGRVGSSSAPAPAPAPPPQPIAGPAAAAEKKKEESGVWNSLESMMPDMGGVMNTMVSSLGGLAVGGLMGVIREMAATGLPKEWTGEATKLIDQVTTQLGAKPLDSAKSSQLFAALGLGGESKQEQGGQARQQEGAKAQGTPYDPAKQNGGPRAEGAPPSDATRQQGAAPRASVTGKPTTQRF